MAIRVASINAYGLCDLNKRMGFLKWLSHFSFDVVCIQESHCTSSDECNTWFSCYGYLSLVSCGSNHSCGTVILFRTTFSLISSSTDAHSCTATIVSMSFCFMPLILTLRGMIFLPLSLPRWTCLSLTFCAEILMKFSIEVSTVPVQQLPFHRGIAAITLGLYFVIVVW